MNSNHPPLYLEACSRCNLDPDTLQQLALPRGPDGRFLPKTPHRASKARSAALTGSQG